MVGSPTEPAFRDSGLANGTTCYYVISAVNADGESPASTEISATPQVLTGDGVWTRLTDGVWSSSDNWQNSVIAAGVGQKATFAQTTGVTVTLDDARTLGSLEFANANYTLAGSGVLTLDAGGALPAVSVAAGFAAELSAPLSGTAGFAKTGEGTLTLSGENSYSGITSVDSGTLKLQGAAFSASARTYSIASGAVLTSSATRVSHPAPRPSAAAAPCGLAGGLYQVVLMGVISPWHWAAATD